MSEYGVFLSKHFPFFLSIHYPDSKVHGQHGVNLGPVGPRRAPCWPHELCYQGSPQIVSYSKSVSFRRLCNIMGYSLWEGWFSNLLRAMPNISVGWLWPIANIQASKPMMSLIARFLGQLGTHMGPTGSSWAPCWPHEPCYLGYFNSQ